MADKIIRDVDDDVWTRFTGYAKSMKRRSGDLLTEVLESFLKGKMK